MDSGPALASFLRIPTSLDANQALSSMFLVAWYGRFCVLMNMVVRSCAQPGLEPLALWTVR